VVVVGTVVVDVVAGVSGTEVVVTEVDVSVVEVSVSDADDSTGASVVDVVSGARVTVESTTGVSAASATAVGAPSAVGVSVTWDRTLPTAAAATTTATIVAPTHAMVNPRPLLIPRILHRSGDTELTHG
jgi:hypothetical protein